MKLVYILKRDQNSAKIIHADNDKKGAFIIFWANFIPLQRGPYMTTPGLILLAIDDLGIRHCSLTIFKLIFKKLPKSEKVGSLFFKPKRNVGSSQ